MNEKQLRYQIQINIKNQLSDLSDRVQEVSDEVGILASEALKHGLTHLATNALVIKGSLVSISQTLEYLDKFSTVNVLKHTAHPDDFLLTPLYDNDDEADYDSY